MSTGTLEVFDFRTEQLRVISRGDEPWFVALDVANALQIQNVRQVLPSLDGRDVSSAYVTDRLGRSQPTAVVNESGLYDLIFRSRRPEAREFRRWVTSEVLPSLRSTGRYETGPVMPAIPETLPDALRLAADLAEERDQARAELEAAEPKVTAYESFLDADGHLAIGDVAKALGLGRTTLFRRLRQLDILQSDNLPYQRYAHHFEVILGTYRDRNGVTHPTHTTKVRPSGVEYIRRRLIAAGDLDADR